MGIRFYCPNGHKLNVKSFLAGKRGVCPHCGVKLIIPDATEATSAKAGNLPTAQRPGEPPKEAQPLRNRSQSTATNDSAVPQGSSTTADQRQEPDTSNKPAPTAPAARGSEAWSETVNRTEPTVPEQPPASSANVDPLAELPNAMWYVRLTSGDQYGPVKADLIRQWLDEQRIPPDALVWREDWPDWQRADAAIGAKAHEPRGAPPLLNPKEQSSPPAATTVPDSLPSSEKVDTSGRPSTLGGPRRRSRRNKGVLVVLTIATLVLLVLLILVVFNPGMFVSR